MDARDFLAKSLRNDKVDAVIKSGQLLPVDFLLGKRQRTGDCQACHATNKSVCFSRRKRIESKKSLWKSSRCRVSKVGRYL